MKPFLILQLRPEDQVADEEYASFLKRGQLDVGQAHRVQLDRERLPDDLCLDNFSGVIVGGGPGCVSDAAEDKDPTEARIEAAILRLMPQITQRDFPFMGCCYGIGILGHHLGAPVTKQYHGEAVGAVELQKTSAGQVDPLLRDLPESFFGLVGHKEAMDALPENCVHLLAGEVCPYQMVRMGKNVYATQFHPEAGGESFALRIQVYKQKGYFRPEEAAELTERVMQANTETSGRILANFVSQYGR